MKYTEKAMNIVKDYFSKREQITGQIDELTSRYKAEEISGKDFAAQEAELKNKLHSLYQAATKELQDTGAAYRDKVNKLSEITGAMLHEDAKLLELDMKISPHQFEVLVEKHKGNPVMAQLLQEYGNKHEGLYGIFVPTVGAKTEAFDLFIGYAQNAIRTPDSLQSVFFLDGKYTPVHCTESE